MGNWIELSTEVPLNSGQSSMTVTARLDRTTLDLEHIRITLPTIRAWLEGNDLENIIAARDEVKHLAQLVQGNCQLEVTQ